MLRHKQKSGTSSSQTDPELIVHAILMGFGEGTIFLDRTAPKKSRRLTNDAVVDERFKRPLFSGILIDYDPMFVDVVGSTVNHVNLGMHRKEFPNPTQRLRIVNIIRIQPANDLSPTKG